MKKHPQLISRSGFTLLEILLVVAAIGILAGIVISAINPGKQLAQTRDAQRKVDVNTILNAVYQYIIDENGSLPGSIPSGTPDFICQSDDTGLDDADCLGVDLTNLTDDEEYLVSFPVDPTCGDDGSTCYEIEQTSNGRIRVLAPNAELTTITVTR